MEVNSTEAILAASVRTPNQTQPPPQANPATEPQHGDSGPPPVNAATETQPDLSQPSDSGPPPVDAAASPRGAILSATA
jgi:hypothetical protein